MLNNYYLFVMVLKLHKSFVNIRVCFLQIQYANGCDRSERSEILEVPASSDEHLTFHAVKTELSTVC